MIENEIGQLYDEKNNQKFLANSGVQLYFSNVFVSNGESKLPMVKHKLRKVLVDFGLCQTCLEIDQRLDFIKVWYRDEQAVELKELFVPLRSDNKAKESQAIELVITLGGSLVIPPKISREVKTYSGLTKLLYQEFVQPTELRSMIDDNPFNEIKEVIRKGNLSPSQPLQAIFGEEVD